MNLFEANAKKPLADRIRPSDLSEIIGQNHLVGDGGFLRSLVESGTPTSIILWGPPGTGKTTLARIIASSGNFAFDEISAVTNGLPDVKKIIERAKERTRLGETTVLFVDEIHRFNKAQQDAFLPHVESGTIILIGATTENPSFEVIGPLLSRSRVVVLEPLSLDSIMSIIDRGMTEFPEKQLQSEAKILLAELSAGDARAALNGLETAASLAVVITTDVVKKAMQTTTQKFDKGGEYHYNVISAYIKSLRGGAVDAALFYLARLLESGEDPKFIARRMVIFASEDIGLADNTMLPLATATFEAIERIGMPEGRIILGHTTIALATASKSRAANDAISRAISSVKGHPEAEVPLHLRNAPTSMMKDLGYGRNYQWEKGFKHPSGYMPEGLENQKYFEAE